jgi:hypothetical protein
MADSSEDQTFMTRKEKLLARQAAIVRNPSYTDRGAPEHKGLVSEFNYIVGELSKLDTSGV